MNENMKNHILENWGKYKIVSSQKDMVALLNILEAHGETLDSLHDVTIGNSDWVCSICFSPENITDRDVAKGIMMHNSFYKTHDELMQVMAENAEDAEVSLEEYLKQQDIRTTSDGYVCVLWY